MLATAAPQTPDGFFSRLHYQADTPPGTTLGVNVLDESGKILLEDVDDGTALHVSRPVRVEFVFSTTAPSVTPALDSYSLSFDRADPSK